MTDEEKTNRKILLKEKALEILHERIEHASTAMNAAQQSANEEDKSSVGDKYQTGRAMAQNDRDIYARQLEAAQKEISFVQQIDVRLFCTSVEPGAFVDTGTEKYFFLAGLGIVDTSIGKVYFLSISSPIGKILHEKRKGDKVVFNNKELVIADLY